MDKRSISDLNQNAGSKTGAGYYSVDNDNIPTLNNPNMNNTRSKNLKVADLSQLPEDKKETTGVVMKESREEELLGEGSVFEAYLNEKREYIEEVNAAIDAHNEMVAAQLGEDVPDVITDEDVERSRQFRVKNEMSTNNIEEEIINIEDEYTDPLEQELELEEERSYISNIDQIEKETSSRNIVATTVMSEDLGQDVNFKIDDEDLLDDDDDTEDKSKDEDANLEELRLKVTDKLSNVSKKLDLRSFTISNKPVSVKTALTNSEKKVADWALFSSKMHFALSEFSGTEISTLGSNPGLSQYSTVYNRYKLFLDHMIGEDKPKDVESLVKSISFLDNDDLFGGIYVANFTGANYLPYDCPKCNYTFLSENIPIEEMYSFEKPEDEKTFNDIRNERYYQLTDLYTTEIVPITDKFAFSFREPSIYSIVFETALLDEKFTEKYRDIISVISYIDNIYLIDEESQSISPIGFKRFHNNKTKDVKSRIITYSKILNSLRPDEYNIILAYLSSINTERTGVKWKLPECTCPKCGTVIKERETTAENLVFMRHQLAALATTSLK